MMMIWLHESEQRQWNKKGFWKLERCQTEQRISRIQEGEDDSAHNMTYSTIRTVFISFLFFFFLFPFFILFLFLITINFITTKMAFNFTQKKKKKKRLLSPTASLTIVWASKLRFFLIQLNLPWKIIYLIQENQKITNNSTDKPVDQFTTVECQYRL